MRRVVIIFYSILLVVIFALLVIRQNYKNSPDYNYITANWTSKTKMQELSM